MLGTSLFFDRNGTFCYRSIITMMTALLMLITSGCVTASVSDEPFKSFSQSLVELNQGTDKALASLSSLSESRFKRQLIEELEKKESDLLDSMQLVTDPSNPFSVKTAPLFLKTEQFKLGASQVTASLIAYSQLLLQLADPELLPEKTFDDLAKDLNANAFQAISTMTTDANAQVEKDVALFSQLAVAATKVYLKSKQKNELVDIIKKNQPVVKKFAQNMQRAVLIITQSIVNEYSESYIVLARKALNESTRQKAIEDLIALDRNHINQIKTLQALHLAYGQIPAAHAGLATAVLEPAEGLPAIIRVLEAGKQLKAGYDQALAANKAASAQFAADKAAAQADALEAEAETAALRAASANVAAINARQAADADPQNDAKRKLAEDLEKTAKQLQEEAATKKAAAQELRIAADAVQQKADDIKKRLLGVK